MPTISALQTARSTYQPKLPQSLATFGPHVKITQGDPTTPVADRNAIEKIFPNTYGLPVVSFTSEEEKRENKPLKVGVVLSGGQAPGGHNVIAGIFDAIKAVHPASELYGFRGGPSGMVDNKFKVLDQEIIDRYRNTGGFDIIGSGRTKLEEEDQFAKVAENCDQLGIKVIVVIGGDDSNTNACVLAEYFRQHEIDISVIGCPKTIDGDLKNEQVQTSFGFDTATKVYSELIGNIERDANSARKYWHFIRLMGRSASHIALECALQTHPNATIISEEVQEKDHTLMDIVRYLAGIVRDRAKKGKNFGIVLVPEGLIEFIPEMKQLIGELNELLAANQSYFQSLPTTDDKFQYVNSRLSQSSSYAFSSLPGNIQMQLLMDRDPHGNVQVSRIETEKLLVDMIDDLLREWKARGEYEGKFSSQSHFFGYEGRCAAPSNFDADYCYSLGYTAAVLGANRRTGYLSSIRNLELGAEQWEAGGIPLTMLMNLERRGGADKPVIRKALVDLEGKPFQQLQEHRSAWAAGEDYVYPGPIQYFGPSEVCDASSVTLRLERS